MALKPALSFSLSLSIAFRNFVGFYSSLFHQYLLILLCTTHNFADSCTPFLEFIQLLTFKKSTQVRGAKPRDLAGKIWDLRIWDRDIWVDAPRIFALQTPTCPQKLAELAHPPQGEPAVPPCGKTLWKLLLQRQDRGFPKVLLPSPLLTAWPPA